MVRPVHATLAVLVAISLLAGCGGDDDGGKPSKEERQQAAYEKERAAYVEEADARCRRIARRIQGELASYQRRASDSPRAAAALVAEMAPRVEYEIRAIRILVLPPRDVPEVLRFLSTWYDEVQEAKRDPVAFVEADQPFPEAVSRARDFGFEYCGTF